MLAAPECVSSLHVLLHHARVCSLSSAWAKFSLLLNPFLCPTNLSGAPPNRVYSLNPFLCLTNQLRGSPRVYPLNQFLCPIGQLRGSPEQSVSIKELQGRLAQVVRPHQEEAERLTDTIWKVNTTWVQHHLPCLQGPERERGWALLYRDSVSCTN